MQDVAGNWRHFGYDSNHLMQAMTDANGDQGADQSKRRHAAEAAIDGGVELAEFFRHLGSSTDASEGFRADQERRAPSWRT